MKKRTMTHIKKTKKKRKDCEKRSEIMEEIYYHREERNEERDYSFLFFFNTNIVYATE